VKNIWFGKNVLSPNLDHDKRIAAVEVEGQEGVKDDDNKLYNLHGGQIPRTSRTQHHIIGAQITNLALM
jgi:hypothetical protein